MRTKPTPEVKKPIILDPTQVAFTVPQVAVYLGISHWQVRMNVWQGRLPARKVGKAFIILKRDADAFLQSLPAVRPNNSDWLQRRLKRDAA